MAKVLVRVLKKSVKGIKRGGTMLVSASVARVLETAKAVERVQPEVPAERPPAITKKRTYRTPTLTAVDLVTPTLTPEELPFAPVYDLPPAVTYQVPDADPKPVEE